MSHAYRVHGLRNEFSRPRFVHGICVMQFRTHKRQNDSGGSMTNDDNRGNFEKAGEFMGKVAGQMTDRAMDMTGAVFNSMSSMLGEWWSSQDAQRAASSFDAQQDQACRTHFESSASQQSGKAQYEG